jgi:hypothetical protein
MYALLMMFFVLIFVGKAYIIQTGAFKESPYSFITNLIYKHNF